MTSRHNVDREFGDVRATQPRNLTPLAMHIIRKTVERSLEMDRRICKSPGHAAGRRSSPDR